MIKFKNKGMALIWSLLLLSILTVVSTTIASMVIRDTRITVDIQKSTQAYAAAKTGMEWGVMYSSQDNNNHTANFNIEGYDVQVNITRPSGITRIESTAGDANVKRKLQYEKRVANFTPVYNYDTDNNGVDDYIVNDSTIVENQNGSFKMVYNFGLSTTTTETIEFGLHNTTTNQVLAMKVYNILSGPEVGLYYKDDTLPSIDSPKVSIDGDKRVYRYKAELVYNNKTSAQLYIFKELRSGDTYNGSEITSGGVNGGKLICYHVLSIDLTKVTNTIASFNSFYFAKNEIAAATTTDFEDISGSDTTHKMATDTNGALQIGDSKLFLDNIYKVGFDFVDS